MKSDKPTLLRGNMWIESQTRKILNGETIQDTENGVTIKNSDETILGKDNPAGKTAFKWNISA